MIILDTCVLRERGLESSSAELLRTIRAVGAQGVAVPWIAMEEMAAFHALKYQEKHAAAVDAVKALKRATPWQGISAVEPIALDRVRQHWREQWASVVDVISPSDEVMRDALFREANALGPCRSDRSRKTGARDAAIWLTAVEYARQHTEETVYFVSSNTRDFGDGTLDGYPHPMAEDLEGLDDRFVHVTSLDDVLPRFAQPTEADTSVAEEVVRSPQTSADVLGVAKGLMGSSGTYAEFPVLAFGNSWFHTYVRAWLLEGPTIVLDSIRDIKAYRVGAHVWYSVTARWFLCGDAFDAGLRILSAASVWDTRLLFNVEPYGIDPQLNLVRSWDPQPASVEEFEQLPIRPVPPRYISGVQEVLNAPEH